MSCVQEILSCQFPYWYNKPEFRKITFESVLIQPIPDEFIKYLQEDGIIIPCKHNSTFDRDELSDDEDLKEVDRVENTLDNYDFSDIENEVKKGICKLGGKVFVKLNWSAPTDAAWINMGTMQCNSFENLVLLLKSSDKVIFDLEHMFDECINFDKDNIEFKMIIVLREWKDIDKSTEFRLYVHNNQLKGISQRDCSTFYDFLISQKSDYEQKLLNFYNNKIHGKFELSNYTVDCYIDKNNKVWLVDFNVFGRPTNLLLFESWEEIIAIQNYDFRIITSRYEELPDEAAFSRGPIDVSFAPDFSKFMNICRQQQQEEIDE